MAFGSAGHDRRTILIEYRGDNPKLTSGHLYSRNDIAKAFGLSPSTARVKLKGKVIATDEDMKLLQPQKCRTQNIEKVMKFVGKETKGFKNYQEYTYKEISALSGIKPNALNKRIGTAVVFNAHHVRPSSDKQASGIPNTFSSQFDTYVEMISAKWLRKSIRVSP